MFNGDVCAANLTPGQPNSHLKFTFGPNGTICGAPVVCADDPDCDDANPASVDTCVNGVCEYTVPPTAAPSPDDAKKNRYLSFVPSNGTNMVAYRVELAASVYFPLLPFPVFLGWVGEPDAAGLAFLVDEAEQRSWSDWNVVHVTGCGVVPVATYNIYGEKDDIPTASSLVVETIEQPLGSKFWGDTVGSFDGSSWTPPQLTVNIDDAVAAIKTFQVDNPAPKSWVDVEPTFTNRVVNIADVFWIILAFQGNTFAQYGCSPDVCGDCPGPACCPCACTDPPPCPVCDPGGIDFSMVPDIDLIDPHDPNLPPEEEQNDHVVIDVFVAPASDVSAYEVALEVTGGDTGSLDVTAMVIDKGRTDYIFGAIGVADMMDNGGGRFAAMKNDAASVEVTAANGYLGTFTLTASTDASGVFEVKVRDIDKAFLSDSTVNLLQTSPGDSIYIGVDVASVCQHTDNCDDFNDCTTDICNAGVCDFVNVASGTPCDDGQFCTEPDTCNNKGNCLGGPNDPCLPGELCIEVMDICIPQQGGQGT